MKLVHARAPLAVLFLIERIQELMSSCSKMFEIVHLVISYTRLSVPKTRTCEKLGMC